MQDRVNKNPAISADNLAQELVNSLVEGGLLPPSEANSVKLAALQQVVAPTGQPSLSGRMLSQGMSSGDIISVDLQLTNVGTGDGKSITLNQVALRTLAGSGTVTYNTSLSPPPPLSIGNLAVGTSTTVRLFLNVPSSVIRFSVTENGTLQDVLARSFNFSTSQSVGR